MTKPRIPFATTRVTNPDTQMEGAEKDAFVEQMRKGRENAAIARARADNPLWSYKVGDVEVGKVLVTGGGFLVGSVAGFALVHPVDDFIYTRTESDNWHAAWLGVLGLGAIGLGFGLAPKMPKLPMVAIGIGLGGVMLIQAGRVKGLFGGDEGYEEPVNDGNAAGAIVPDDGVLRRDSVTGIAGMFQDMDGTIIPNMDGSIVPADMSGYMPHMAGHSPF